ncbi:MAG: DUF839 domain-containing protein [Dehalococcoidia bacterium]|nr:DUF839 domain-containing protein [Dehalococcoidia bacterium]
MPISRSTELVPVVHVAGCARFGPGAETCRWKCGSQCAHPAPNIAENEPFQTVLRRFVSRRAALRGAAAASVALVATPCLSGETAPATAQASAPAFEPITLTTEDRVIVAAGYASMVLIRWGDPLFPDAPPFDPRNQSAAAQERQFGYNNDFIGFFPIPGAPDRALLAINHEYTNPELMFPQYSSSEPTRVQVDVELAAHGMTIVEIRKSAGGAWEYVVDSPYNRRLTGTTAMLLTGPAAGSPLLQTAEDSTGTIVTGMLNNCAGGKTPWGTVLTCEENFNQYFAHLAAFRAAHPGDPRIAMHERYGITGFDGTGTSSERKWERYHDRFDISKEPNERGEAAMERSGAGMAQAPSESSSQLAVQMTFPSALEAGTLVTLKDSSGQPIVTFAPAKTFQSIVISTPELKEGETYTFYTGGTSTGTAKDGLYEGGESEGGTKVVSFEMGDTVTYVNESGVTTGGSGMGGPGGFGGGRRLERPPQGQTGGHHGARQRGGDQGLAAHA